MVIEFFKHVFGICGDHWHPNVWTLVASAPIVGPMVYYVKCTLAALGVMYSIASFPIPIRIRS